MTAKDRRSVLRELIPSLVLRPIREARAAADEPVPAGELAIIAMIGIATAVGSAVGLLVGRGRSPERVS